MNQQTRTLISVVVLLFIGFTSVSTYSQQGSAAYLKKYGIIQDSINELTFKNPVAFKNFIATFEDKQGFELPKFFISDNTGKLLKHQLDVRISQCGKGDVNALKKKYHQHAPSIEALNTFFNEPLKTPSASDFIVIFIWHEAADKYNRHTFETYHIWKTNDNIEFYFLNLDIGS